MTDIEIARRTKKEPITNILSSLGVSEENYILYGNDKAKITSSPKNSRGKLILVTAISPTPYGEGKTTVSIGLGDAFRKLDKQSILVLREPSMGPVFGMKGGATGGGYSQVVPMEDINLHFTGDFHAITAANDLLCAAIDNHIYHGNELGIETVTFNRALDVNDRALRHVSLNQRTEKFNITAASEIMALFCLAESLEDLKNMLGNIVIGYDKNQRLILAKELHIEGALVTLLKDAFYPNLVQTLEHTPAIIHGGPFANIAHGCNSIIATKAGLGLADYVVTEAGFGSDMGALKFFDIKCKLNDIYPDLVIINATIRSLKYHGNGNLKEGLSNLKFHILNMQKFHDNVLVILNKFQDDTKEEIKIVNDYCKSLNTKMLLSNMYKNGSKNTKQLADTIVFYANKPNQKHYEIYAPDDNILEKIEKVCRNIYGAKEVIYKDNLKEELKNLDKKYQKYRICISKTPASITDDPKVLGFKKDFSMTVTGYNINNGAGFITILMGNVVTMPGLSKKANYLNIDVKNEEIIGIF